MPASVLGALDRWAPLTLAKGHVVKPASQDSDACFNFWLCALLIGLREAAPPSEPQALAHLLVLFAGVGGSAEVTQAVLSTPGMLSSYPGDEGGAQMTGTE